MRYFFVLLLYLTFSSVCAQKEQVRKKNSCINFGVNIGFNSVCRDGGFIVSYKFTKFSEVFGSYAGARYQGIGFALGMRGYILCNSNWGIYLSPSYSYLTGNKFSLGEYPNQSTYKTFPTNFYSAEVGVCTRQLFNTDTPHYMMFYLGLGYSRKDVDKGYILLNGPIDNGQENKIKNRINSNIGVSITVLFYFVR